VVKQFASEDATVVVGTVIDPELSSQVRVTVVATGLGRPAVQSMRPVQPLREAGRPQAEAPQIRMVRPRTPLSGSDYAQLDTPTIKRQQQRAVGDGLRPSVDDPEDLLDIPAFLRRQAD